MNIENAKKEAIRHKELLESRGQTIRAFCVENLISLLDDKLIKDEEFIKELKYIRNII